MLFRSKDREKPIFNKIDKETVYVKLPRSNNSVKDDESEGEESNSKEPDINSKSNKGVEAFTEAFDLRKEIEQDSKLENVENLLKYMMEKHKLSITEENNKTIDYVKGYRERMEIPMLPNGQRKVKLNKWRGERLRLQIQQQKDSYLENIERKVKAVSLRKPLQAFRKRTIKKKSIPKITYSTQINTKNNTSNDFKINESNLQSLIPEKSATRKVTSIAKRIKLAMKNSERKIVSHENSIDNRCEKNFEEIPSINSRYSIRIFDNINENHILSSSRVTEKQININKLKKLVKSIDEGRKEFMEKRYYISLMRNKFNRLKNLMIFRKDHSKKASI